MKMIIAPAKQMAVDLDNFAPETQPQFQSQAHQLLNALRQLTYAEAQKMWRCSDKLAHRNFDWLQQMDLTRQVTPALLSYRGLQYQYMAPDLFTAPALDYVRHNLRILSGFYGLLWPFDGIVPYRLEMQARLSVGAATNLYDFWGNRLYHALAAPTEPIINLASREYAKAVTPYLQPNQPFITVVFASLVDGQLKTKATLAKMARGAMVRYLAENQVTTLEAVKNFDHPDYRFDTLHSTAERLVFVYQK